MSVLWNRLLVLVAASGLAFVALPAAVPAAHGAPAGAESVTASPPMRIVSGYVQAGGPVAGSAVRIYLPGRARPVRTTTSGNGYFLARLPVMPERLLVVATGGRGPVGRFRGTMTGIVANPSTHESFYVNPASTLMAAYRTVHPQSTRANAWTKVRGLLGLKSYHNLTWALGGRPTYFDGVKFLRTARKHGGFDAYVASLIRQIDHGGSSAAFRRTADETRRAETSPVAGLIGNEAAGYLGVAAQGASVVSGTIGLMNFVGSLVGWSPSGGPTPGQILSAIDQVQTTLNAIQTQIANLSSAMAADFSRLQLTTDQDAYNDAVGDLNTAYKHVTSAQGHYADYVSDQQILATCASSPIPATVKPGECAYTDPTSSVSKAADALAGDLTDYQDDITNLESDLSPAGDVFHDALLPGENDTTPALTFFVDKYLDVDDQLFLPSGSSMVQNFTATVLSNQAWAYYLVVAGTNPDATVEAISTTYLGSGYADWPQGATPTAPPSTPTSAPAGTNNLNAEMTYLQSILPVPEWMAVDANPGGLMYMTTSNVGLASTYLPTDAASRADCVSVVAFAGGEACSSLTNPLTQLSADMSSFAADQGSEWAADATEGEPPATYWSGLQTGWTFAGAGNLATVLPRLAGVQDVDAQYYFNPGPVSYGGADDLYWVLSSDDSTVCTDPYVDPNSACAGESEGIPNGYGIPNVLDWLKLYFKTLNGGDATCTWSVGQANTNTDPCFDMPALVSRPLQPGEVYVP